MADQGKCPDVTRWNELLAGSLPEAEQAGLADHLTRCAECRKTLDRLAGSDELALPSRDENAEQRSLEVRRLVERLKTEKMDATVALDPASENTQEFALDFLDPSDRPDCLGKLGAYHILSIVGQGGMGVVLKSHDPALNRIVAIKVLSPQLSSNAVARKRFLREAQAAAAVSHDHVVTSR